MRRVNEGCTTGEVGGGGGDGAQETATQPETGELNPSPVAGVVSGDDGQNVAGGGLRGVPRGERVNGDTLRALPIATLVVIEHLERVAQKLRQHVRQPRAGNRQRLRRAHGGCKLHSEAVDNVAMHPEYVRLKFRIST